MPTARRSSKNVHETILCNTTLIPCQLVRQSIKDMEKQYERSEENIKALQSVGQIIGEVLKQLDDDRCSITS